MNLHGDGRVKVLIVEDNPSDAMLVQIALEEDGFPISAEIASDGEMAINRLCRGGEHHASGHPDLIILDLNLPKRDGTEVLQAIRASECTVSAPVVVLSSSPESVSELKVNAARVKADCYLTKPLEFDDFLALGPTIRKCYEAAAAQAPGTL